MAGAEPAQRAGATGLLDGAPDHVPAPTPLPTDRQLLRAPTQIDGLYDSLDEAIGEAIAWLQIYGLDPLHSRIGVEVSTAHGDWRTCRLPGPLLCPLLCTLPR